MKLAGDRIFLMILTSSVKKWKGVGKYNKQRINVVRNKFTQYVN